MFFYKTLFPFSTPYPFPYLCHIFLKSASISFLFYCCLWYTCDALRHESSNMCFPNEMPLLLQDMKERVWQGNRMKWHKSLRRGRRQMLRKPKWCSWKLIFLLSFLSFYFTFCWLSSWFTSCSSPTDWTYNPLTHPWISPYLQASKRELLADYALPVAVILLSFLGSYIFRDIPGEWSYIKFFDQEKKYEREAWKREFRWQYKSV